MSRVHTRSDGDLLPDSAKQAGVAYSIPMPFHTKLPGAMCLPTMPFRTKLPGAMCLPMPEDSDVTVLRAIPPLPRAAALPLMMKYPANLRCINLPHAPPCLTLTLLQSYPCPCHSHPQLSALGRRDSAAAATPDRLLPRGWARWALASLVGTCVICRMLHAAVGGGRWAAPESGKQFACQYIHKPPPEAKAQAGLQAWSHAACSVSSHLLSTWLKCDGGHDEAGW